MTTLYLKIALKNLLNCIFSPFLSTGGPTVPEHCSNSQLYPTYKKRPCQLCETLKATSMGQWSDCILESVHHDFITNQPELTGRRKRNTTTLDLGFICGTGKRIKVVACSYQGNSVETADKCNGAGRYRSN